MAFVGYCNRHGNYIDRCMKCGEEDWLHLLTKLIKSGIEPDEALKKILADKSKHDQEVVSEKIKQESKKKLKALMRNQWITNNLPSELRDDTIY